MEKLHQELLKFCKKLSEKHKITYSSYHTAGEGEHKILQDIKKLKNEKNIIIYGLDADLFFLALASNVKNIYLMRERSQINDNDDDNLSFISIDLVREICNNCIKKEINQEINNGFLNSQKLPIKVQNINSKDLDLCGKFKNTKIPEDFEFSDFTEDFIFICYLIGNDFLPHLPSMDIKKRSMELLIKEYVKTYLIVKKKLIHKTIINMNFLKIFLKKLSNKEDYFFINILNNNMEKKCTKTDKYEIEIWKLENMCFSLQDSYGFLGLQEDNIRLGKDKPDLWKYRYYENYFHVSYQEELINELCENYLKGLMWITLYYFKECSDWKWRYYHFHAPFISDISNYLYKTNMDLNKIVFKKDKPLKPLTQLLSVIPPKHIKILPKEYRFLMTDDSSIIDLFPSKIEIDTINKDMHWKCIPIIPLLDINRINDVIKNIKINKKDSIKNEELDEYKFH